MTPIHCIAALAAALLLAPAGARAADPVELVTREFTIEAPETLARGWHDFRFTNRGGQTHFVYFYRLVDGKTIADQLAEVVPAFDAVMEGLRSGELGKEDIGPWMGEHIPPWGLQMTPAGGVGLLAPGQSAEATLLLDEPGTYLFECYVKSPDGRWHTSMGMLKEVRVTAEDSGGTEPEADVTIRVGDEGVAAPDRLGAGRHVVRIDFVDTPPSFMPYDLHLARLRDDTDLDRVLFWMDWSNVGGLRAPAPVEFLGGVENLRGGAHGYLSVDLKPGRYLWISETLADTHHRVFTVN